MYCSSHKMAFEILEGAISLNGNYKRAKKVATGRRALFQHRDGYMD